MNPDKLSAMIGLLIALSVATERLVEIVKGVVPPLNGKSTIAWRENLRCACNQLLAVGAGVLTAFLARPAIPAELLPSTNATAMVALGLLASGGSGFWNSVLAYVLSLKDMKAVAARDARRQAGLPVAE